MNKIIIDGYNMIHLVPDLRRFLDESLERAREELILHLRSYLMRSKVEITLVFDGAYAVLDSHDQQPTPRLTVLFSRHPFKADPLIKLLIAKEQNKKNIILVTKDNDIIHFARSNHVQVLSPAAFYDRIEKRFKRKELHNKFDKDLTAEELAEWLEIFGEK